MRLLIEGGPNLTAEPTIQFIVASSESQLGQARARLERQQQRLAELGARRAELAERRRVALALVEGLTADSDLAACAAGAGAKLQIELLDREIADVARQATDGRRFEAEAARAVGELEQRYRNIARELPALLRYPGDVATRKALDLLRQLSGYEYEEVQL